MTGPTKRRTAEASRITDAADGERQYVIHPHNNDAFVRLGRQVIDACQLSIGIELWLAEMRSMKTEVAEWCRSDASAMACYSCPRGSHIALFFVPMGEEFDFDLGDRLTELGRDLGKFNIGPLEIYQIPQSEVARFLAPEWLQGPIFERVPTSSPVAT